jgi:MYXO-CTERM domain-containing protein
MSRRLGAAVLFLLALTTVASARPQSIVIDQEVEHGRLTDQGLVPYNTVFLNKCPTGCVIRPGGSNSINNTWGISSQRTLTAFPYGDQVWADLMKCVKDVFEPYNVVITDVDPGTANHFEIMVAGAPGDLGMGSNIGGVAPGSGTSCTSYLNNALVFDFAKVWGSGTSCGSACIEDMCATAAQEIGHTWQRMDHVTENKDPMTYFNSPTRKYFQNVAAQCGSDCVGGTAPFGQTCSGPNNQNHSCTCGGQTQNSHTIITGLFGAGPGTPPDVKITAPKVGASVEPGFSVYSEAIDNSGTVTKVELWVNGAMTSMLTAPPYVFNAPTNLMNGTHKVEVRAYDPHNFQGKAMIDVIIGPPCKKPSDCSKDTDTCVGGRCVPGAGVQGGLGSTCASGPDCSSGQCASDGTSSFCVEPCVIGDCPEGFGCDVAEGAMMGVCWPGLDDGSGGGCGCQSSEGGPFGMMLFLGLLVLTCRRRRSRS